MNRITKSVTIGLCAVGALTAVAATAALPRQFTRTYEGTIDNKHRIRVRLTRKGERLTGSYSYSKVGKPLQVQGTLDEEGNLSLDEFDAAGKRTGTFNGKYEEDKVIRGSWSAATGDRVLPFRVEEAAPPKRKSGDARGPFSGSWSWEKGGAVFNLELRQVGNQLTGTYTAVTSGARRVDQDSPVKGEVQGRTARVTWTSGFSGGTGRSTLTLVGETLRWEVTQEPPAPNAEYWAPRSAVLKRDR